MYEKPVPLRLPNNKQSSLDLNVVSIKLGPVYTLWQTYKYIMPHNFSILRESRKMYVQ